MQEQIYINNVTKAYALFWAQCSKATKNKIEARSDFKSNIECIPFKLLKVIKEHSMNFQENWYSVSVILDAQMTLFSTKQNEAKSLQDYTKRLWTTICVFKSYIEGPVKLSKVLLANNRYTKCATNLIAYKNNKTLQE